MKPRTLVLSVAVLSIWGVWTSNVSAEGKPVTSPETFADAAFSSGKNKAQLVELFTSQGCSSCPPAESFLGSLENEDGLWKDFVPVAFHVDYWDRLGWKDPYASAAHTQRQYAHRNAGHVSSVYTPGFVINGQEWRGFFQRQPLPENSAGNKAGVLKASLVDGKLSASFAGESPADLELHVAVLGSRLVTDVTRGENSNRKLRGEFVVLAQASSRSSDGKWDGLPLPSVREGSAGKYSLALWVTRPGDLQPLQATGGWLAVETAASAR